MVQYIINYGKMFLEEKLWWNWDVYRNYAVGIRVTEGGRKFELSQACPISGRCTCSYCCMEHSSLGYGIWAIDSLMQPSSFWLNVAFIKEITDYSIQTSNTFASLFTLFLWLLFLTCINIHTSHIFFFWFLFVCLLLLSRICSLKTRNMFCLLLYSQHYIHDT